MNEEPRTWLVQRLCKPHLPDDGTLLGKLQADNPFSFGGGLRNGGLSKEAMDLLRPIFSFDYMGAAEYEFGEVPKAFGRLIERGKTEGMRSGSLSLTIKPSPYEMRNYLAPKDERGYPKRLNSRQRESLNKKVDAHEPITILKTVYYLVPASLEEYCKTVIKADLNSKLQCKCGSGFRSAFLGCYGGNAIGWFELDNGFFYFLDKEAWEKTVKLFTE